MFSEYLNTRESDLVVEKVRSSYRAYFGSNKREMGIGSTEIQALENLKRLINDKIETRKSRW